MTGLRRGITLHKNIRDAHWPYGLFHVARSVDRLATIAGAGHGYYLPQVKLYDGGRV